MKSCLEISATWKFPDSDKKNGRMEVFSGCHLTAVLKVNCFELVSQMSWSSRFLVVCNLPFNKLTKQIYTFILIFFIYIQFNLHWVLDHTTFFLDVFVLQPHHLMVCSSKQSGTSATSVKPCWCENHLPKVAPPPARLSLAPRRSPREGGRIV